MLNNLLLIDGENFLHKLDQIFQSRGLAIKARNLSQLNLPNMLEAPLEGIGYDHATFYAAKLQEHKESLAKSRQLILWQRNLKTSLEKQRFEFIIAGHVRPQLAGNDGRKTIFHEKGVDVRIAVDMVSMACDKKAKSIILCSSDSDLQPAVAEVKRRGVELVYLGFESNPNRGLIYTASRTILLRDAEVLKACGME